MNILVFLWILAICFMAFLFAPVAEGFIGESSRIVFFHVPMAWVAVLSFLVAAFHAVQYLRTGQDESDLKSSVAARQGFFYSILATVTGAIFAKIMWGSYWNWDPRETSITILLFVYAAYLVLRSSIDDPRRRANLTAVYAAFAIVPAIFLTFVIPRMYTSLHPDTLINVEAKIKMQGRILGTFLFSLGGFTLFYVWLYRLECRIQRLISVKEGSHE
ncbi:MAG TPA: cytochrome c biogenesis protein CcsA [Thermoanaerobaculia bacterium]|nr:cytochrome c biogenesis protein CcsA [Thermoanaerobaculia bacterium]HUM29467.1 cytochrome c biogenesis protein CcsA [Thermoanaerobaculia bacterium]HXK67850.1 cytochrome c biogenesis protein CcsA [Thermoanaerobaculia bacterium]